MNRELTIVSRREYLLTLGKIDDDTVIHQEVFILGLSSIFYMDKATKTVLAQSLYFPAGINEYRINVKFKENFDLLKSK